MLAEERRDQIKSLLKNFDSLSIQSLSQKFKVSPSTIRRDLQKLERKKILRRTHGGAVNFKTIKNELDFSVKKDINVEEKKKIGILASELVEDGDSLFIESGSTSIYLSYNLGNKKNLTIVTNSCEIGLAANAANPKAKIFLTGGYLKPDTHSLIGHMADTSIRNFKIEKAFVGITALDPEEGITTVDHTEAYTKKMIIEASKLTIGLMDSSKFGKVCLNYVCSLQDLDIVVSSENLSKEGAKKIREMGIKIITGCGKL